ncbi:MAG: thioredoxin [Blautia sp.]|nr:thioredoxin [Blautia sp.]
MSKSLVALQTALIAIAIGLIVVGVFNGSAQDVLYKAINICTECVGLG